MPKTLLLVLLILCNSLAFTQGQGKKTVRVAVVDEQKNPLPGSTVYLLKQDSTPLESLAANSRGMVDFIVSAAAKYRVRVTQVGYTDALSELIDLSTNNSYSGVLTLKAKNGLMKEVVVVSKKPAIQFLPDKTVINPEANITNAGATVMDLLEKAPGITVSKDGTIIMKGKPSVTVLIDGKPTQLSGQDLQAYLQGISASQVDVVELIENPSAKYDASGNAGIINIKLKSNKLKGFNGSLNLSIGQGFYIKTGNSLNLNYRNGKLNWFLNYGVRAGNEKMNLYTLRKYFNAKNEDSILLQQPDISKTWVTGHNLKTGLDFFATNHTTLGVVFNGGIFERDERALADIDWMTPDYHIDSSINTWGENHTLFKRAGVNVNGKFTIDEHSELTADIDYVRFNINEDQNYQTRLAVPGSDTASTKGNFPSQLNIITAKADYSRHFKGFLLETGLKTAMNKTDNLADFYYYDGSNWQTDLSRSNHFLYNEKISAAYASVDAEIGKWHWQTGLRYELTSYKADQLGNAVVKDSAFSKNYGNLFPSGFVSYQADSNNMFTFRLGRRIDRPPFQNLNPFLRVLNKYTFEGGNPFIKPQYTWNFSVAHTYKQKLTTEVSYNYLKDYFSQIFFIDSNSSNVNKNIIIYSRGNVGTFRNFGITETFQQPVTKWWNLTVVAVFNHKIIKGVVWAPISAAISQLNTSINNQVQLKKGWGIELSGYYQTKSQIDLQEWLKPQGELDAGLSKQVMKNKGTFRLTVRDITYFQNYSGYSTFQNAYEPFTIKWDSRVMRFSFNWRFGKAMKPITRSEGGATDEIDRAGNGN